MEYRVGDHVRELGQRGRSDHHVLDRRSDHAGMGEGVSIELARRRPEKSAGAIAQANLKLVGVAGAAEDHDHGAAMRLIAGRLAARIHRRQASGASSRLGGGQPEKQNKRTRTT